MPVFKDVKYVKSVATKDFNPFDGVEARLPKQHPRKDETAEEAKKVQDLIQKFATAANGESSGICLAALDELRIAIRPILQDDLVLGQSQLDTQRRLSKLLDTIGGSSKLQPENTGKDLPKTVQSKPDPSPMNDPGPPGEEPNDVRENKEKKRTDKFTVHVNKVRGSRLGITTCWADGDCLIICALLNGLVQEHNAKQPASSQIEVGDRIVSIDGEALPLMALKEKIIQARGKFIFEVVPHTKFTVKLHRGEDDKLGLDVTNKPYDQTLLVRRVLNGVVSDWNNNSNTYRVSPGDRIISVNGDSGPGQFLRDKVNEARGEITLAMIRNNTRGD